MDWTRAIDAYCERLGPGLWAEPVNFLTNTAFLIAAAVMGWRTAGMPTGQVLSIILAIIGIGSGLFHSYATAWASMADVVPILVFILAYLYVASRDYLRLRPWVAALVTAGFIPYAAATVPLFGLIPGLGSSAGYAPVPVLILGYAVLLRQREPATARGLAIGAGILIVSLGFRTVDTPLCARFPMGTHFLWHVLNGIMLGWMIEVWRRHAIRKSSPAA